MSKTTRPKERKAANTTETKTLSINERILKECHVLYADPEKGLVKIARDLKLELLAPRKKITILLIGNHSAGKSSFINWYVEETVQKTGVAIETQGISFVTSGKKRETLHGPATLQLYPHFSPLREIPGIMDSMTTEISTSKQKKFSLVTFVDTPGLVDGEMKYPFDVNKAITWLGNLADLIFVFFDPIGQALCKRTINLVESLNDKHPEKLRFYLSKADEAGPESDRQRVLMQIVQELCKRPGLNKTNFDMPTIYIPNVDSARPSRCVNKIDEVCVTIEKTIDHTIQNTLNSLEKDCDKISQLVNQAIQTDNENKQHNFTTRWKSGLCYLFGLIFPIIALLGFLPQELFASIFQVMLDEKTAKGVNQQLKPFQKVWTFVPTDYQWYTLGVTLSVPLLFILMASLTKKKETMPGKRKTLLLEHKAYVENLVQTKKPTLYNDYLKQSAAEYDF